MGEDRGSIAFFTTYRPPMALDLYSCPLLPTSNRHDEIHLTDGKSYNSNARVIPPKALKAILEKLDKHPTLATAGVEADVDSGRLSGMVFVSERTCDLETLHIALRFNDNPPKLEVFNFAQVYGTFNGVRMEDSACFAENDDYIVYVTTKDGAPDRRQPWTTVYKTNLKTGATDRLTPSFQADLSPSVSPLGKRVAVASFQKRGGWRGEREKLKTDIFVMNIAKPFNRVLVIKDGGWPTWGSEDIIFFHRKVGSNWGVFRANIRNGHTLDVDRVTPEGMDAITPVAIDSNRVAVATIRKQSALRKFTDTREEEQYRQIEVYDSRGEQETIRITAKLKPTTDHFNPFIIENQNGEKRVGYNRCKTNLLKSGEDVPRKFDQLQSQHSEIELFRVSGVFPTFSPDGSKLAFVDNDFQAVWLADDKGLRKIYQMAENKVFSPVWNQNNEKDILYICFGPSFSAKDTVHICAIINPAGGRQQRKKLTKQFNNAFPSTNGEGTQLVFRSTRDHHENGGKFKNLYIMKSADEGEFGRGEIQRLTTGNCIDTHCKWSPRNDWIVFSSNRDMPEDARKCDEDLDSGYFSVYLVKADNPDVLVRVMYSGSDLAGHVNHPFFSPDGKSIVVTSDVAAVSADPMSLPLFLHSARPYGDIFTIDIDSDDINKNEDLKIFNRITHSRYENATGTWTKTSTRDPSAKWNQLIKTLPMYSTAPWLSTKEKMVVASKISTAAAALMLLFPYVSVVMLGLVLLKAFKRAN